MQTTDKSQLFTLKLLVISPEHKDLNPSRFNPSCFLIIFANYPFMHFFFFYFRPSEASVKEARVSSQFDAVGLGVKNRHEQKSHGSICGKCKHERSHPQSTSQVGFAYSLNYIQYIMSQVCQCSRQCCTNTSGHHYESIMYTK